MLLKIINKKFEKFKKKFKKHHFKYQAKQMNGDVLIIGKIAVNQRVELSGSGQITFKEGVILGYTPSPYYKSTEIYIEARNKDANIEIGENVVINNNAAIVADHTSITIGRDTLIGPNFVCFDSHFHHLDPQKRRSTGYSCASVTVGENVFIGINVTVLKGSTIGDNCVIGAGCTISGNIPPNSIVSCTNQVQISELRCQ
ncbi:DapH/DapD/GlmU-related protein [Vibrio vulnificus]|uniref:DapH/DapD/GlmU-related protein n=1 Tax=Vibrio vulnificus TaxID=672 RepID=UPI001022DE95|nr:DapH/DapD/GlmU-related protein [Vibrio vulnificus]RZP62776.1 transferase [Vibrio vulnificus]RZR20678.1 transferase [Vibrio vulnificus]HDY7474971.1 hypothetical protein [Vibrio vulnificus]HDY7777233.1 hypothetical protein [Vibrio vulnificus]